MSCCSLLIIIIRPPPFFLLLISHTHVLTISRTVVFQLKNNTDCLFSNLSISIIFVFVKPCILSNLKVILLSFLCSVYVLSVGLSVSHFLLGFS